VDRLNEHVRFAFQALIDDTLRRRKGIYWSSYDARTIARFPTKTAPRTLVLPDTRSAEAA
jgi:hypothetical protein